MEEGKQNRGIERRTKEKGNSIMEMIVSQACRAFVGVTKRQIKKNIYKRYGKMK